MGIYHHPVCCPLGSGAQFTANLTGLTPNTAYDFEARAYNGVGWAFGQICSFTTTSATLPQVTTQAASNVSATAATLNGPITDSGGIAITDSGFLLGARLCVGHLHLGAPPSNLQQVHATPGADGSLSCNLTGLTLNTSYDFLAYATNIAGTSYGMITGFQTPQMQPAIVTTLAATDVGTDTATIHGSVAGGNGPVTDSAFVFGTGEDPSQNSRVESDAPPDADGAFAKVLTGLTPGTTYYFMAFASEGTSGFGNWLSFTTLTNTPDVETQAASGVTATSATLNGYITKNKGLAITGSGFLWGTDPQSGTSVSASPGEDGRTLTYSMTGLQGGTTYYVQAYATNSAGTGSGDTVSFTTPAAAPTVTTTSAGFDASNWAASLKGNIAYNGGALITEYGFRYGTDQKSWTKLAVAGDYTGDITASLAGLDKLSPGATYYVQAYAVNSAGTGCGTSVSFTTPGPPVVDGSIDKSAITSTTATLAGNITDTGGQGVACTFYQFQYRLAGSSDWQSVDTTPGSFGTGPFSFSFNLAGLNPGAKYEFQAQAYSAAGWGSSQTISFATTWGENDKETAVNMKAAGYSAADIATALKNTYGDTDAAAFTALQYAGFGANDISAGLKNSAYGDPLRSVVGLLQGAGFDIVTVAGAIIQVFPIEAGELSSGNLVPGVALCLKNAGYGIDDIITAMKAVFNYQPADCVNNLGVLNYSSDTIYGSIARVYGADALAGCVWQEESGGLQRGVQIQNILGDIARILNEDAGFDPLQCAAMLQNVYTSLNAQQLAGACRYAGFDAASAGAAIVQLFGAADPLAVARDLIDNGASPYGASEVEDFLVKGMNCSALQLVQIITTIDETGSWVDPMTEIPRVLTTYYQMDAPTAAKTMYAAGWTEANDKTGYGLASLIEIMQDAYNIKTADGIIGVLKGVGLSPVSVADYASTMYVDWLPAYREQGYTATDAAGWFKSAGYDVGDAESVTGELAQAGFLLKDDIVLGLRNVYGLEENSATSTLRLANKDRALGWKDSDIVAAVSAAYGADPIQATIREMKSEGDLAGALRQSRPCLYRLEVFFNPHALVIRKHIAAPLIAELQIIS